MAETTDPSIGRLSLRLFYNSRSETLCVHLESRRMTSYVILNTEKTKEWKVLSFLLESRIRGKTLQTRTNSDFTVMNKEKLKAARI
jgi:hypothetical protein